MSNNLYSVLDEINSLNNTAISREANLDFTIKTWNISDVKALWGAYTGSDLVLIEVTKHHVFITKKRS